jgi:antitoxin (DNA-binding transcriptional repressor) of toxin-antitoxin stability system
MRVKIGELKTHLSKYLRKLEQDGELIEICVRETPVAYMTPVGKSASEAEKQLLETACICVTQWGKEGIVKIDPPTEGYQKVEGFNSVESMRRERKW